MTYQRLCEVFKLAGKMIAIGDLAAADSSGMKVAAVNATVQFSGESVNNNGDLYDDMISVVIPFQQRISQVTAALDRVGGLVRSSMDSYLQQLAVELGQPDGTDATTVLTTLAGLMPAASGYVSPSGEYNSYFSSQYSVALPTATPPTLPDSWISVQIV